MAGRRRGLADRRKNVGYTQEQLAEAMQVEPSTVGRWERGETEPLAWCRPRLAQLLGVSISELERLLRSAPTSSGLPDPEPRLPDAVSTVADLVAGIVTSDTTDDVIWQYAQAATSLAEAHTCAPARQVLREVLGLQERTQALLRRNVRLSQRRELYRIEAELLAHACVLLGDLRQHEAAEAHGLAALTYAREAGHSVARASSALSKTLRWQERFIEAAGMAARGLAAQRRNSPITLQLASQEANAIALLGDNRRANDALRSAQALAESVDAGPSASVWSFPIPRQAVFAQSVATHTGDAAAALRAAATADEYWDRGGYRVAANWAQIRVGAGTAHLMRGDLDASVDEIAPVLRLAPELRVSTVTGYIATLMDRLAHTPAAQSTAAIDLSERCREFNACAVVGGSDTAR